MDGHSIEAPGSKKAAPPESPASGPRGTTLPHNMPHCPWCTLLAPKCPGYALLASRCPGYALLVSWCPLGSWLVVSPVVPSAHGDHHLLSSRWLLPLHLLVSRWHLPCCLLACRQNMPHCLLSLSWHLLYSLLWSPWWPPCALQISAWPMPDALVSARPGWVNLEDAPLEDLEQDHLGLALSPSLWAPTSARSLHPSSSRSQYSQQCWLRPQKGHSWVSISRRGRWGYNICASHLNSHLPDVAHLGDSPVEVWGRISSAPSCSCATVPSALSCSSYTVPCFPFCSCAASPLAPSISAGLPRSLGPVVWMDPTLPMNRLSWGCIPGHLPVSQGDFPDVPCSFWWCLVPSSGSLFCLGFVLAYVPCGPLRSFHPCPCFFSSCLLCPGVWLVGYLLCCP